MLPFEIPAGTTLDTLFTDVLPRTHAKMVPATAGTERFTVVCRVVGWKSFTLEIRGAALAVREGEEAGASFWQVVTRETAQRFLDDWLGEKRFGPLTPPKGPMVSLSDPRILKRLSLVSGKVELALTDVATGRMAMTAASGSAAKKAIHTDDPDVVIEAPSSALLRLLDGKLSPEDALVDGSVTIRGKKLVAMQLALALGPFYPKA